MRRAIKREPQTLTEEEHGDAAEEQEQQEGGEDAAATPVLTSELSGEPDVAVRGKYRARRAGSTETSRAHRADRYLQKTNCTRLG